MPSLNDQFALLGLKIDEEKSKNQETIPHIKEKVSEDYYLNQNKKGKRKVSITIDRNLYDRLILRAKKENRSFSSLLTHCASLGLKNLNETRLF